MLLCSNVSASFTPTITAVPGQPFACGKFPLGAAYSPNGKWFSVGNYHDNSISSFSVNSTTGELTELPGSPLVIPGAGPCGICYSPDNRFCVVADFTSRQIRLLYVDQSSGNLALISSMSSGTGGYPLSIAFAPNGQFVAVGDSEYSLSDPGYVSMFLANKETGGLTYINTYGPENFQFSGSTTNALVFSPDNRFLAVAKQTYYTNPTKGGVLVFEVNQQTGQLSNQQTYDLPAFQGISSVSYSPNGDFLACCDDYNAVILFSVDKATGALTQVSSIRTPNSAEGHNYGDQSLSFSPDGNFIAVQTAPGLNINFFTVFSVLPEGNLALFAGPLQIGQSYAATVVAFSPIYTNGKTFFSTVNTDSSDISSYALNLYNRQNSSLFQATRNKYFFQQ